MAYQQIPGLNPSRNLEDYHCAVMMDADNTLATRRVAYRRVKDYIDLHDAWLLEMEGYPANALIDSLRESVEDDMRKWRASIKQYIATR